MNPPVIHAAKIWQQNVGCVYLFLRQIEPFRYIWFQEIEPGVEAETPVWGGTTEEAILAARIAWKFDDFSSIRCGFRYTLPERDEVGSSALFHQMVASYTSSSGVYFDEELGSNCIVHFASSEAKSLWKRLESVLKT